LDLLAHCEALAADMEKAADLDAESLDRPVTRYDARRWAGEVRLLAQQHAGVVEALRTLHQHALKFDKDYPGSAHEKAARNALSTHGGQ
jgi:hypothetical protein